MSLIIKGIDLPKGYKALHMRVQSDGVVRYVIEGDDPVHIIDGAYAIQIPKNHGRLIDADDIKAKCINEVFESMGTVAITDPYPDDEWADDICDVPTILEAEEK